MEEISLRGKKVKVDIRSELMQYDWGNKCRWTEDKLIATSPFRYDKSPSFFVNLTGEYAGTWADSGFYDVEWSKGNFVKLLSFLRNETYEETEEYLAITYGADIAYDELELGDPNLTLAQVRNALPANFLTPYKYKHDYLTKRGISERVQRMMRIGYDPVSNAVVMPWLDPVQNIANCKFRSVRGKVFWYTKNALPIKHLVYGIDAVYAVKAKRVALCESEIDALTWMTWGVPAIAVGGVSFNDKQADIIRRSPIQELIISADNDKDGNKLKEAVCNKLGSFVTLQTVNYPQGYKDVNEMLQAGLKAPSLTPVTTFKGLTL